MPMMVSEMNATAQQSVENLMDQIRQLTAERQQLRESGAPAKKLERNRIKLARKQWELSHALIERYHPAGAGHAA
jgi:uncharacterized coiled-coil DUF342 family protein